MKAVTHCNCASGNGFRLLGKLNRSLTRVVFGKGFIFEKISSKRMYHAHVLELENTFNSIYSFQFVLLGSVDLVRYD